MYTFNGVLPVANPKTKGSLVFKAFAFIASLIYWATLIDASALVSKNFGDIFSINENLGKLANFAYVYFNGTFGRIFR